MRFTIVGVLSVSPLGRLGCTKFYRVEWNSNLSFLLSTAFNKPGFDFLIISGMVVSVQSFD